MPNVVLRPPQSISSFRRIAAAVWSQPRDPTIFGSMQIRYAPLKQWLAGRVDKNGDKVTITHAVARAIAICLQRHPDLNAVVRWGRLQFREDVDVFLQVMIRSQDVEGQGTEGVGQTDLSGICIRKADRCSVEQMGAQIRASVQKIRSGKDESFKKTKEQARALPSLLLQLSLRIVEFLQWGLNIDTTIIGAPRDPFGSAMVTSVGMLGLRTGYAPFFPLARTPIILMIGALEDTVVAEDGQPVVRETFMINATLDHRVIDGFHASVLARELRELLESPELLELEE